MHLGAIGEHMDDLTSRSEEEPWWNDDEEMDPFLVEDFSINPEFTLEQSLRTLRDREGYQRGDQFMVLANILTAEGFVNSLQVRKIP